MTRRQIPLSIVFRNISSAVVYHTSKSSSLILVNLNHTQDLSPFLN